MRNVLRFLLPAAVLLVGLPLCLGWFSQRLGDRAAEESFALVEENVRRAAVECYALEGARGGGREPLPGGLHLHRLQPDAGHHRGPPGGGLVKERGRAPDGT